MRDRAQLRRVSSAPWIRTLSQWLRPPGGPIERNPTSRGRRVFLAETFGQIACSALDSWSARIGWREIAESLQPLVPRFPMEEHKGGPRDDSSGTITKGGTMNYRTTIAQLRRSTVGIVSCLLIFCSGVGISLIGFAPTPAGAITVIRPALPHTGHIKIKDLPSGESIVSGRGFGANESLDIRVVSYTGSQVSSVWSMTNAAGKFSVQLAAIGCPTLGITAFSFRLFYGLVPVSNTVYGPRGPC